MRHDASLPARTMATTGAAITLAGILLSGPVAVGLLALIRRSVEWRGAPHFVLHFYRLQTTPFFFGFVLLVGYLMLFAGLQQAADEASKPRTTVALMLASAYAALIGFNYICQTTFVPALATHFRPELDAVLSAFTLSNPLSISWAIEMWGYAFLGGATWFAASMFHGSVLNDWIRRLMIVNGIGSITSAVVTSYDQAWVVTATGMAAYVGWNVLVFVISALILVSLSKRRDPPSHRRAP